MPKFDVRIDVSFNLEVEAEDEDQACEIAEDEFDPETDPYRILETIAFEKDDDNDD